MNVQDYLTSKGLGFKTEGKEYRVQICPFCDDEKWHLYIHSETGAFFCHKCNVKGNLYQLRQHLGDQPVREFKSTISHQKKSVRPKEDLTAMRRALLADEKPMEYVASRGFTEGTVERFRLGLKRKNGTRFLAIPHFRGGACINIKFRSLPPAEKSFHRVEGCESILFNEDAVQNHEELIIVEGELDCITLLEAGYENVVGLTGGARTFLPRWYDLLKGKKTLWLCLDNDPEGQEGARDIARRLGWAKCYNVALPDGVNDVNEFFCQPEVVKEDFDELLQGAELFPIENTLEFHTAVERYFRQAEDEVSRDSRGKIDTPWASVNRLVREFRRGNLVVLSAPPKMGKTMLALNLVHHNLGKNHPCFFYCLEMSPMEITGRYLTMHSNGQRKPLSAVEKEELIAKLEEVPFVLGYNQTGLNAGTVLGTIRETVKRYGIRLVVLDHLHYLVRGEHQTEQIGTLVRDIKMLASELDVAFILIAQPKKIDLTKTMNFFDLKYASEIASDADTVLCLQRKRLDPDMGEGEDASFSRETIFRVEAAREVPGGHTKLLFNPGSLLFEEGRSGEEGGDF